MQSRQGAPGELAVGALTALAQAAILLVPAILNGFPFVYWDTGTYLSSALTLTIPYDRPVYYSIFALLLHWKMSLWPVALAQALVIVHLLNLVMSRMLMVRSPALQLGITALLAALSSLPFFAGQIMPDIFTSAMILGMALCLMSWADLTIVDRIFILGVIAASVAFHLSNVLVAFGIVPAAVLIALVGWRPSSWRGLGLMTGAVALGMTALFAANIAAGRGMVMSAGAPVFLFAKLLDDGPGLDALDDVCTQRPSGFAACGQRLALHQYADELPSHPERPSLSDHFLWKGPLESLGGFQSFGPEAAKLVEDAKRRVGWKHAGLAARQVVAQLIRFGVGRDDLAQHSAAVQPSPTIKSIFGLKAYERYMSSLQQTGGLRLGGINLLQYVTIVVSILVIAVGLLLRNAGGPGLKWLALFVLTFLLVNAAATGMLSTVQDRYQSRVIWLVPFLGAMVVLDLFGRIRKKTLTPGP